MRIIVIGFGTVGKSFIKLLAESSHVLLKNYGIRVKVVAVADRGGAAINPKGLDPLKLLEAKERKGTVAAYPEYGRPGFSSIEVIREVSADVLVEVTPTSIIDGEPGLSHIIEALKTGKHVITANKGPMALAFQALMELAEYNNVVLRFSGCVGGGTPILDFASKCVLGDEIVGIRGILNGTTNYILTRMADEGIEFEEVGGTLGELRGIIAEGAGARVEIQTIEELREVESKLVSALAGFYLRLEGVLKYIAKALNRLPEMEMLAFYLYSANMHYSSKQYLDLTVAGSVIVSIISLLATLAAVTALDLPLATKALAVLMVPLLSFIISSIIILMIPKQRAIARGKAVSAELPFALRHMATELRAGIGLYRTIQAVATADYGALSEEFSQVITEVEEGTDTQDALRHLALRTQSKALRNAIVHIIRALKTGGNLSESMSEIAADVSFDLRMAVKEFGMRMNFFGVVFIFGAIVLPVMVAILGGIRNSPIQTVTATLQMLPLTIPVIAGIYLGAMPIILLVFLFYIKKAQPGV